MNLREYDGLFRYLMQQSCLREEDILYVDDIADWCGRHGIPEADREKPFKIISVEGQGCRMLIREFLSDEVLEERIKAMGIRNQVLNVAVDRAEMLDGIHKKLAYLFLHEYARSLPEVEDDLLADNRAFEVMERLGYFKT
jgi:hypothetical protein